MREIPTCKMYYDGDIYKEESNQSFTISSIYDFDDFKNYFDNLTLSELSENYNVSRSAISKQINEALKGLQK